MMPTLSTTQIDNLQAKLNANDTKGFYSLLQSYGDPYGRLGLGVTNNDTWQGQIANNFAKSASNGEMDYNKEGVWGAVNRELANAYLQDYRDNGGNTPSWNVVKQNHNDIYDDHHLPRDAWFPNKLLDESSDPAALWDDYQTNTGATDLWGDAFGIASDIIHLEFDSTTGAITPRPDATDIEFAKNFFDALSEISKDQLHNMARDFTNNSKFSDFLDLLIDLPSNTSNLIDMYKWGLDNPNAVWDELKGEIPSWLAPIVGMQVGNGSIFFPAGGQGGMEPLILDLDGNGAHTTKLGWVEGQLTTYFDMDNDGFAERTAWVAAGIANIIAEF